MKILLLIILFCSTILSDTYYYEYGKKIQLTKLKETRASNDTNITYYQNSSGQKVGVKKEIIVKCKNVSSCQDVFKKYNLNQIENLTSKIILITLKADIDPFELSQKLSLEDDIEFAHPNFIKKRKRR
ncbi:MAG TPA: hypothetical protein EYH01_06040 [Campylobacterales bacterium]|nr:hypothetical protein [Campylobacterales bacterium]